MGTARQDSKNVLRNSVQVRRYVFVTYYKKLIIHIDFAGQTEQHNHNSSILFRNRFPILFE